MFAFKGQNRKLSLNVFLLAIYFVMSDPAVIELFASSRILISDIIDLVSFSPETPYLYLEKGILGFHQSCDQNKNRNHPMKKVKSLRYDR